MTVSEPLLPDNERRTYPIAVMVITVLIAAVLIVYALFFLSWQTVPSPDLDLVPAQGWSQRAEASAELAAASSAAAAAEETAETTLDPYVLGLIDEPLVQPTPIPTRATDPAASTLPSQEQAMPTPIPDPLAYLVAPLSAEVEDSYFENSVFIGSSRMEGLMLSGELTTTHWFVKQGLNVDSFFHEPLYLGDELGSGSAAYGLTLRDFDQVYLSFGINELAYNLDDFIGVYRQLVRWVRYYQPDAVVYLEAVMPLVTGYQHGQASLQSYFNNERIRDLNARIKQLAADEGCWYLDAYAAVADENGNLPANASFDGAHLNNEWCAYYLRYISTHIVPPPKAATAGTEG